MVHEKGVVHRDIKPSNVLLWNSPLPDRTFRAKLADFGIARLLDSTRVTAPGTVIGTAAYLAPEQVRGEEPSPAADIYSLGLMLIEALTGKRAFGAALSHEALIARLTVSPTIPDDISGGWRTLLTAMTASTPARRPTALSSRPRSDALRSEDAAAGDVLAVLDEPTVAVARHRPARSDPRDHGCRRSLPSDRSHAQALARCSRIGRRDRPGAGTRRSDRSPAGAPAHSDRTKVLESRSRQRPGGTDRPTPQARSASRSPSSRSSSRERSQSAPSSRPAVRTMRGPALLPFPPSKSRSAHTSTTCSNR